ncbi:MAG: hypothetical protein IPP31_05305 [Chitinophagaceae bacterium]|nr:hypothetical protein [Chitinophagaceae bacterium]
MQHITIYDFLLLPVYLYIFYIIIKRRSFKLEDGELRKYFMMAFLLRMFGSIGYSLMVQYYYGYGDSFTYYSGGNFIIDQVQRDIGNIDHLWFSSEDLQRAYTIQEGDSGWLNGYISIPSSVAMMKISAIVSILSFNKFLITSILFGLFSFAGQWKLFRVFDNINKGKNRKLLAWAVLYTPSIWFWGSGLMKEAICLGGLGFICHILYKIFIRKKVSLRDLLVMAILVYIIGLIKSYILIIFAVSLLSIFFFKMLSIFKNVAIKALAVLAFLFSTLVLAFVTNIAEQIQILAEESKAQVDTYQRNYEVVNQEDENSEAGVSSKEIDASIPGLILHSPVAIFNCLFRPFIWESRKIIIFLTSLESMTLLFCTLYLLVRLRIFRFFKVVFSNEYILFSLIISLLFALIIGFTTYNFGAIVRYKIMLLPFYYFMLVSIYNTIPRKINPAIIDRPQPV